MYNYVYSGANCLCAVGTVGAHTGIPKTIVIAVVVAVDKRRAYHRVVIIRI